MLFRSGSNNIDIGNVGVDGESKTIRIGSSRQTATYIAGISGATVAGGVGVVIDSDGHLGTVVSSKRFKDEIKPMNKASEAILSLEPVSFRYKKALDPKRIWQFGLVAEQVEKVDPDLVARDAEGKPYTVRYEAVNAMLLNEFLKEHRKVQEQTRVNQEQEATISQMKSTSAKQNVTISDLKSAMAQQQKEIQALRAGFKEQAAQIREVNDQLALRALAPQLAANSR